MIKFLVIIVIFFQSVLYASINKEKMLNNLSKMQYMKVYEKLSQAEKINIEEKYKKREHIYEMAKKNGVLNSKKYKEEIELIAKEVAMKMFLRNKKDQIKVTRLEKEKYYNSKIKNYTSVHAFTIVRKNKKDLLAYINELERTSNKKQFELFKTLAKKYSQHPGASRGGDMGYIGFNTMARPFGKKTFELKKDEFTKKPFKTILGYHIVYVKDIKIKALKDVARNIEAILKDKKYKQWFKEL